jgi:hypothetical protein
MPPLFPPLSLPTGGIVSASLPLSAAVLSRADVLWCSTPTLPCSSPPSSILAAPDPAVRSVRAPRTLRRLLTSDPHARPPPGLGLGVQRFGTVTTLALCPRSPECISTAEEANDAGRYVPPWTYARSEESVKRGLDKPTISRSDAMAQLVAVVRATSPDGWEPNVVKQQGDEVRSYGNPHCRCLLAHLLRSTAVPLRGVHLSSPGPRRRR